ncbi:MAG TPA: hypothetical protein VHW66_06490 [Stellaceae bacterium]|jgi:hypothetical protein|nr:hypothetical protein [Stellaceae bacterium]
MHLADTAHDATGQAETSPPRIRISTRPVRGMALLLILGSSPMVEGIPAFFAASRYAGAVIALMADAFIAAVGVLWPVI